MKIEIKNYFSNLIYLLKTSFYAMLIGFFAGLLSVFFINLIDKIQANIKFDDMYLFIPIFLFVSSFLMYHIEPDAIGSGTEKIINSIKKNNGNINVKVIPVKIISTIITVIAGGSIGKVGPCAQIGAAFASSLAKFFNFTDSQRRKFLICGISAGFSVVLGTPISSALFAVEVLVLDKIFYELLFLSMISSITAFNVSTYFNVISYKNLFFVDFSSGNLSLIHALFFGFFSGILGVFFIFILKYLDLLFSKIKVYTPIKGILGGIIIVILTLLTSKKYLGFGIEVIKLNILGNPINYFAFLFKSIFTALTLSSGGSGGLITPIFFIGSSFGNLYAQIFQLDLSIMSAIGILALLASTTNAPIASCILGLELFGNTISVYMPISIIISFIIASQGSVYISESINDKKSSSLSKSDFDLNDLD